MIITEPQNQPYVIGETSNDDQGYLGLKKVYLSKTNQVTIQVQSDGIESSFNVWLYVEPSGGKWQTYDICDDLNVEYAVAVVSRDVIYWLSTAWSLFISKQVLFILVYEWLFIRKQALYVMYALVYEYEKFSTYIIYNST